MRASAIVVAGVAGSGKSTIGAALAALLDAPFQDADALHSTASIAKMAGGTPLSDDDRWPWLDRVGAALSSSVPTRAQPVVACSALRRAYRDRIVGAAGVPVTFVLLSGSPAVLRARMQARVGHFMPTSLLDTQLALLERLDADERGFEIDVDGPMHAIVERTHRGVLEHEALAVRHGSTDTTSAPGRQDSLEASAPVTCDR